MIRSAVVLLSGGMDSTTLAYFMADLLLKPPVVNNLHLLSVDYGQRHSKELECAKRTAIRLGIPHHIVNLSGLRNTLGGSALTSPDLVAVPEGHYTAPSMRLTVVANRNMILLAVAAGYASSRDLHTVAYAAHAGDHPIYPDCRPAFVDAMRAAVALGTEGHGDVELFAPFVTVNKGEIARVGQDLGVVWTDTWSCYVGGPSHCGRCGTCVERKEAFALANIEDPTQYEEQP
jgi:7-cyano-7-deazaguanine synthase